MSSDKAAQFKELANNLKAIIDFEVLDINEREILSSALLNFEVANSWAKATSNSDEDDGFRRKMEKQLKEICNNVVVSFT